MSSVEPGYSSQDVIVGTVPGITVDWSQPGWPSIDVDDDVSLGSIEIVSIGSESDAGPRASQLFDARQSALALLGAAAITPGCDSLELRYLHVPAPGGLPTVRMFVTARAIGDRAAAEWAVRTTLQAAATALPRHYVVVPADSPREPGLQREPYFELRRQEEVTWPVWEYISDDTFYYQINDDPGDGSGWADFWETLARSPEPIDISLVFRPSELLVAERELLGHVTSQLAILAETRQDYDVLGYERLLPGCENARMALESWRGRLDSLLQRPLLVRLGARCSPSAVGPIMGALATAVARRSDGVGAHPMTIESADAMGESLPQAAWEYADVVPFGGHEMWAHERAPTQLRRLPYLYGINEAAALALLPVGSEAGVPGFRRARRTVTRAAVAARESGPSIQLGVYQHHAHDGAPVGLPLAAINRHVLITGTPGSGKTTTVQELLVQLWDRFGIPFLVIESVKTEHRNLVRLDEFSQALRVVSVGRDDLLPLRLNPLQPPPGVRREAHASEVLQALRMAMPLQPPLPQLLEVAIDRAYTVAGWGYETTADDGHEPPSMRSLVDAFASVFSSAGYVGEAHNISAAFEVRIRSLLTGSRGRVLDTVESTDFDGYLEAPLIIELDELGSDEERSLIAALVLARVRAAARSREGDGLRHVVVLEEAHRILPAQSRERGEGADSTRSDAVEEFVNGIAELRAMGEGFIISSQSPARLARASFDMAAARIVHGLASENDRRSMLEDMSASDEDAEIAARLMPGDALVRWPGMEDPQLISVRPRSGIDTSARVTDASIGRLMERDRDRTRALLPYALCWRDVCREGCDSERRRVGGQIGAAVAQSLPAPSEVEGSYLDMIASAVRSEVPGDLPTAYCSVVHLVVGGSVTVPVRVETARSQLLNALGDV